MTKYLIDSNTLTGIANAIREQTGDINPIAVSNMAQEIESIEGGGSVNYSTTEHEVGTWIDGSTIYEKTIAIEVSRLAPTTYDVPADMAYMVCMEGIAFSGASTSANSVALGYYVSSTDRFVAYYNASTRKITVSDAYAWANNGVGYITIRYVKSAS